VICHNVKEGRRKALEKGRGGTLEIMGLERRPCI